MTRIEEIMSLLYDRALNPLPENAGLSDGAKKAKAMAEAMRAIVDTDPMAALAEASSHLIAENSHIVYDKKTKKWHFLAKRYHRGLIKSLLSDENPYRLIKNAVNFIHTHTGKQHDRES